MPTTPAEFGDTMQDNPFSEHREKLMTAVTLIVLRAAQRYTPVRTGLLRRSETTRVEPGGLRGFVGTNVVYAPFVHKRSPFFEQALVNTQAEIARQLQQAGDEYLDLLARTTK